MNDFTKVERPITIPNTPGGVWQVEKKRKARDRKGKQLKYQGKDHLDMDEEHAQLTETETESADEREYEDQAGYGALKHKKPHSTIRIDLKI
ncbi:MAG: hypothetical protein QUS12_06705 [Methanosarcina sp.]|nr:hypothetical protein [Methanosarcina sp.]